MIVNPDILDSLVGREEQPQPKDLSKNGQGLPPVSEVKEAIDELIIVNDDRNEGLLDK